MASTDGHIGLLGPMESEGGIVGPRDDGVHELGENLSSRDVDTGIMGPLDDGDDQAKPPLTCSRCSSRGWTV